MFDSIIIGSGPAGIQAAIYLKRFKKEVVIITKDRGALANASNVENYFGFSSINGNELLDSGLKQVKDLGVDVKEEEALSIEEGNFFTVKTDKAEYTGKTVLLAMGKIRPKGKINGLEKAKNVSYCAVCDGFFYRRKKIALIGSGNYMLSEYDVLKNQTNDIWVFTNQKEARKDLPNLVTDEIVDISDNTIKTANQEYKVDGIFLALDSPDASDFSRTLGVVMEGSNIKVDDNYMTNIKGIFAAGDVIGGIYQIVKAASDGANAAFKINDYLKKINK